MNEKELLVILEAILGKVDTLDYIVDIKRLDSDTVVFVYKSSKEVSIKISELSQDGQDGTTGKDGKDGLNGKDGKSGTDGKDGKDGVNGVSGKDGNNGDNGTNGKDGVDGVDGIDGDNGKDGVDGKDGDRGKDGKPGVNGEDGEDGNGIKNIKITNAGKLIITTDDKTYDLGIIRKLGGGGGFQEFTYTNSLPMPNDVGGLPAGTTFDKMGLKELWTKLLYAYDYPEFVRFDILGINEEIEVGEPIPQGMYISTWLISDTEMLKPDSIDITYVTGNLTLASGLSNTGQENLSMPEIRFDVPTLIQFKIEAMNTLNEPFSRTKEFFVKNRIYVGESFSAVLVNSDSVTNLRHSALDSNINGEYEMQGGGYKWFCYPATFGDRNHFFDIDTGLTIPMAPATSVLVTNDFGVEEVYKTYRTYNTLGGGLTVGIR